MTETQLRAIVQAAIDPLAVPLDGHAAWKAVCLGLQAAGHSAPLAMGFKRTATDKVMISYKGHNGIEVTHV